MSRDCGFEVGDRSTRTLYDTRLIRAYKLAGLGAVVAWDAIVDESWAQGQRVGIEDALLPLPYQLDAEAIRDALTTAGLLDAEGRIREDSWDDWFVPAETRRRSKREKDREYARRAAASRWALGTESEADRTRVGGESLAYRMPPSVRPSVRSDRPPRAPAREGEALQGKNGERPVPLREMMPEVAAGFHPVPKPGGKK